MFRLMDEQLALIRLVTSRLESEGFPYMITGSIAMAVYAEPRMTRDIDLVIECHADDAQKLVRLFETDCYVDDTAIVRAVENQTMFNIIHREWIAKVDFIVRKAELYREAEFERRRQSQVDGVQVWMVSPEDLILSKLVWMAESESAQQSKDVSLLLESVPNLDFEYIETWAPILGVQAALENLRPK